MGKRPSLLDTIKADEANRVKAPAPKVSKLHVPKDKPQIVKSTVYFPKPAHEKLREIAFTQNCKVHDLVLQGISRVLKEHGYESVEELKAK